jgi:hypothetical protein
MAQAPLPASAGESPLAALYRTRHILAGDYRAALRFQALAQSADRAGYRAACRAVDRLGGDRFAVLDDVLIRCAPVRTRGKLDALRDALDALARHFVLVDA